MNEAQLPGIGKKFWMDTESKEKLTVISHDAGRFELYFFKEDEEFPSGALTLTDGEARDLGATLHGSPECKIVQTMDMTLKDMVIEWIKVAPDSKMKDRSIMDLQIRKATGASVIAIIRGDTGMPSPSPDEVIREDDTLLVIGSKEQTERFKETML
jgi:TrkA domain protein